MFYLNIEKIGNTDVFIIWQQLIFLAVAQIALPCITQSPSVVCLLQKNVLVKKSKKLGVRSISVFIQKV